VPGFFLYFPSRAQRSPPLRLFIEAAKELALRGVKWPDDLTVGSQLPLRGGAVGLRPELMAAALCTSRARGLRRSGRAVAKAANDR
jgi:hypothetical protein